MSVGLLVVQLKYGLYVGHLSMFVMSSFGLAYNGSLSKSYLFYEVLSDPYLEKFSFMQFSDHSF